MANRYFINGGVNSNWGSTSNWATTSGGGGGSSVPTITDAVFLDANSPDIIIDTSTRSCLSLNCTGYTGLLTMSASLVTAGAVTLSATMTTTNTVAASIQSSTTSTWTSNGCIWNSGISVNGSATFTFSGAWTCTNLSLGTGAATIQTTLNGSTITVSGNYSNNITSTGYILGTTEVIMVGTGNISHAGTSTQTRLPITINTTGTITVTTSIAYNTGTFRYIAGTVVVNVGCSLSVYATTTLNTGPIEWRNVGFSAAITVTLQSDLIVTGTLTLGSTTNALIINGAFEIVTSGAVNCPLTTATVTGTATIRFTTTQTATHTSGTAAISLKLLIDAPGGTVTFVGDWQIKLNTMKCVAGTVVTPKGTWTAFGGGGSPVQKSFASIG